MLAIAGAVSPVISTRSMRVRGPLTRIACSVTRWLWSPARSRFVPDRCVAAGTDPLSRPSSSRALDKTMSSVMPQSYPPQPIKCTVFIYSPLARIVPENASRTTGGDQT